MTPETKTGAACRESGARGSPGTATLAVPGVPAPETGRGARLRAVAIRRASGGGVEKNGAGAAARAAGVPMVPMGAALGGRVPWDPFRRGSSRRTGGTPAGGRRPGARGRQEATVPAGPGRARRPPPPPPAPGCRAPLLPRVPGPPGAWGGGCEGRSPASDRRGGGSERSTHNFHLASSSTGAGAGRRRILSTVVRVSGWSSGSPCLRLFVAELGLEAVALLRQTLYNHKSRKVV